MKTVNYMEIIKSTCLCTLTIALTAVMLKLYTTLNKVEKQMLPKANELISEGNVVLKKVNNTLQQVNAPLNNLANCIDNTGKLMDNCSQVVKDPNFIGNNVNGIITGIANLSENQKDSIIGFVKSLAEIFSQGDLPSKQ